MGSTWLPNGLTRTDRSLRPTTTSRTVGCSARSPFRRPAFRWASPTPFHRLSIHFFGRGTGETTGFPPHASLAPSAIINHLFRTCGHEPSDYREIESTNGTKAVRLRINPSPGPDLLRAERGSCLGCNSDGLFALPSWPLFRSDALSSANRSHSRGRIHGLARPVHRADLDDSVTPSRHSPTTRLAWRFAGARRRHSGLGHQFRYAAHPPAGRGTRTRLLPPCNR